MTEPSGLRLDLYAYRKSHELMLDDPPFAALIAAAYRRADTDNAARLRDAWPLVIADLELRYNAPGGRMAGEGVPAERHL